MSGGRPAVLTDFPCCGNNAAMIRGRWHSRIFRALLLAAVAGFAPGCTLFDDILPGTPFTPDQPVGEVTVMGRIYIDRVSRSVQDNPTTEANESCSAGSTLLWGMARNTGDVDVLDVFIEIDALGANNAVLGTYRVNVFNGVVGESTLPETTDTTTDTDTTPTLQPVQTAGTSLAVDEAGTFAVCAPLSFGSVAGTAYRTSFIILSAIDQQ